MKRMGPTTLAAWGAAAALTLAGCGQASADKAPAGPHDAMAAPATSTPAEREVEAKADAATETSIPVNLATNPDAALAAMQGQWVSVIDPKSTLNINGNQVVMGYVGEPAQAPMRLDFVTECEGRPISGPRLGFTLTDDDMVLCYTDLEVDAQNLEYFYASRGNRQAFRRPG